MTKKIGICVIGSGRAGMIHAHNFRRNVPYARLEAVVDPNRDTAIHAAQELGIDKYYTDYKEALQDDRIHAVVVVTPTIYHKEIVVAAASASKHILCEKPMAMNAEECDAMITAADAAKVKLQIAFMRRFSDNFIQAKLAVEAGEIGELVSIRSLTRGPSVPQPWMYDLSKSNGPLAEVNSHDIDTLRWFTQSEFATVYAVGGNFRCPEALAEFPDFYDNVTLMTTFQNQKQGLIEGAVSVQYGYDSRVEILGTEGILFIGQTEENRFSIGNKKTGLIRPFVESWRSLYKDAYLAEDRHFVTCILEDQLPQVTGHDGKMAVQVVNAGNQSIKEKRIVLL